MAANDGRGQGTWADMERELGRRINPNEFQWVFFDQSTFDPSTATRPLLEEAFRGLNIAQSGPPELDINSLISSNAHRDNNVLGEAITAYQQLLRKHTEELTKKEKESGKMMHTLESLNDSITETMCPLLGILKDPIMKPFLETMKVDDWEVFISGSGAEKVMTAVPSTFSGMFPSAPDMDIMICSPIPLGEIQDIKDRPGYANIYLDPEGHLIDYLNSLPDQVKFQKLDEITKSRIDACGRPYAKDENNFMLSKNFTMANLEIIQSDSMRRVMPFKLDIDCNISGPAVGVGINRFQMTKDIDYVGGLYKKDEWPSVAEEWKHRKRPSGWPSQALIDKAVSYGTYLVPVAHHHSINPEIEWRYSFSRPDIELMLSLTKKQKKCYMLVKRLCNVMFSGFKIMCTYYVKTSFFWMMEELMAEEWDKFDMDDLVKLLMGKLIGYFSVHNLPSYYIRKANIIDHLPPDHIETVKDKLISLKTNWYDSLPRYIKWDFNLQCVIHSVRPCDESNLKNLEEIRRQVVKDRDLSRMAELQLD